MPDLNMLDLEDLRNMIPVGEAWDFDDIMEHLTSNGMDESEADLLTDAYFALIQSEILTGFTIIYDQRGSRIYRGE